MELQFHKTVYPCLHRVKRELQNQEQTQEVRLGDGMPDIGRVLGAWGQVLLRGKEWRSGGMGVSGGVMIWVLYAPEDGGQVQCVDTWIPFQMKWDFPDTERDGTIGAICRLRSVDARSTSARKLMVRVSVGVLGEAMMPGELAVYEPDALPADVQVLKSTYPLRIPREAGEKPFALEEELTMPGSAPSMEKLIRYELQPEIIDQKVMGSKVVFRGMAILHILYRADDGGLYSWEFELPFSQYGELDHDYDQDASAQVTLAVTSLELDTDEEGRLKLKAGLTGQYLISDRMMAQVVEDAYSPNRPVTIRSESQQVPIIFEEYSQTIHAEQTVETEGSRIADVAFYPDHARVLRSDQGMEAELPGLFQMLWYDADGVLQSTVSRWEGSWSLSAGEDTLLDAVATASGKPQADMRGGRTDLRADILLQTTGSARQGIPMVTALELGEMTEPDPGRPSLILCRAGGEKLWELAKRTGSTVAAIQAANHLSEEPNSQQILLIPVP